MINQAEEPLTRVTMNFFESDIVWLKQNFGEGWTKQIREMTRYCIENLKYTGGYESNE